jgi:arabinofuranan 3-O-arabinosyltransferase
MDLLFALDDRVQDLTLDAEAIAPVARLFGADTIWISNDAAFERFRTARPELVDELVTGGSVGGLGPPERFGDPVVNLAEVDMTAPVTLVEPAVGTAAAPVALVPVEAPTSVIRAKTEVVVLSGSGDGIIDAAAAGLVSGYELIRSSADNNDATALDGARALIITDTNRDQARHWRGSQDTRGHTEPGGPDDDVLTSTAADQRLEAFRDDPDVQTIAIQDGPVRAIASSYGEPFAYRPEDRAVMAVDGDPATAWRVADHGDPIGERIRLTITADGAASSSVRLLQAPRALGARSIETVRITVDRAAPLDVVLDQRSHDGGQLVELPPAATGSTIDIEITGVEAGTSASAAGVAGVGFAEIDLGLGSTTEWIRPPVDGLTMSAAGDASTPLAVVFTRLRADPTDPWRDDPERSIFRRFELPDDRVMDATATLRIDRRASDADLDALLAPAIVGTPPIASSRITGGVAQRGVAAADGDPSTAWMTRFDEAVGSSLRFEGLGPLGDTLVIDQQAPTSSPITAVRIERAGPVPAAVETLVPVPDVDGRSDVPLPAEISDATGDLTITIISIDPRTTFDRRYGDTRVLPAAISELTGTVGIDAVGFDPSATIESRCDNATSNTTGSLVDIDGSEVAFAYSTSAGDLLDGAPVEARSCDLLSLTAGSHDLSATVLNAPGLSVDQVVLADPDLPAPATVDSLVGVDVQRNDPRARDVEVDACPTGCWIVLGEGFNTDWEASLDGSPLGPPVAVDGGFNGWQLPPSDEARTVTFRWTAQTPVTLGLIVSALAALLCLVIGVGAARSTLDRQPGPRLLRHWAVPTGTAIGTRATAVTLVGACAVLISPMWGLAALLPALVLVGTAWRSRAPARLIEATGVVAAVAVAASVLWIVRRDRPFPNAGWTLAVDHLNGLAVYCAIAIAVGAMFAPDAAGERT